MDAILVFKVIFEYISSHLSCCLLSYTKVAPLVVDYLTFSSSTQSVKNISWELKQHVA